MTLETFSLIASFVLCIIGAGLATWTFARLLIRRWQRKHQQEQPRQAVYEVGSPEYHSQIVGMVRTVNEQIAARGLRLPERTAIDIIILTDSEDGQQ